MSTTALEIGSRRRRRKEKGVFTLVEVMLVLSRIFREGEGGRGKSLIYQGEGDEIRSHLGHSIN